jgi:D-galactonate transporter
MDTQRVSNTTQAIDRTVMYRRIAWRLIPFLMLCYIAAFLDRVNVGFAKLTMMQDLEFSDAVYGLGAGIFFIGYFLFEVPSNMLMHRIGARATISRIMIIWGVISGCMAFVQTDWQFYVLRFLLGAAEAGFFPGVILFLTYWFPSQRRARFIALFICAIPASGVIGGPLSGWIMETWHSTLGMQGWQWLFILEAIPSVVLGIITIFVLTNKPREAKWLSPGEIDAVEADIAQTEAQKGHGTAHSFKSVFSNKWVLLLAAIIFCQALGNYAVSFWLPTLIGQAGVKGIFNIGLVSAIPYGLAIVAIVLLGRSSDKRLERRWHVVIAFLAGAIGLTFSALLSQYTFPAMAALCVATMGCYATTALAWNLPPSFTSGAGAAAAIAFINSVGALAGFVSPYFLGVISTSTGSTAIGMYILSGALIIGAVLTLVLPKRRVNV